MANQEQSFDLAFTKQIEAVGLNPLDSAFSAQPEVVEESIGQMGLSPLFSDREDLNDQGDNNGDEVQEAEFVFLGKVIPDPDDEDHWFDHSDEGDCSTSDDREPSPCFVKWCGTYGHYFTDPSTGRIKTCYEPAKPDPRTSCNATAAALKEPVSLLTKYKSQRHGRSNYFCKVFTGPPKTLRQGSPLKKVQTVIAMHCMGHSVS